MNEEQEKQLVDDLLKIVHMGASDTATPEMAMAGVKAAEVCVTHQYRWWLHTDENRGAQPVG